MFWLSRLLKWGKRGGAARPKAQKTLEEIIRSERGLHRLFPEDPERVRLLAASLLDRDTDGDREAAERLLERALELGSPPWKIALTRAKRAAMDKEHVRALALLEPHMQDLEHVPDLEMLLLAGSCAWEAGSLEDSIRFYRQGVRLAPRSVDHLGSLCGALGMTGKLEESRQVAYATLRLDRRHAFALQNLAISCRELLLLDEHRQVYEDLSAYYPDNDRFRCLLSFAYLMEEDFERGWPLHENRDFRFEELKFRKSTLERPRWRGEPIEGKTLLIVCEQGAGDNLMVARWFPEIKRRGARVVVECAYFLKGILGRVPGVDEVVQLDNNKEPDLHFDLWVGSMSLPWIFNMTRENAYAPARYLEPSRSSSDYWRERVAPFRELRIGLAWAGNPGHPNDFARSMKFEHIAPLLKIPGTRFFNLQVPARDLVPHDNLMNWTDELVTFDDTAGLIDQMDLVIAVDTSICHLASALGRPTWVVSSLRPEWRWGRTDLPVMWYPTAKLYCCPRPLDWDGAVDKVAADLNDLARAHAARGAAHGG